MTVDTPDVLVLRALGLGDALTGVAALRGVRRAWPGSRVVLAAPEPVGALLQAEGLVDDVLPTTGVDAVRPLDPDGLVAAGLTGGHVAVNLHGRGPQSHRVLLGTAPGRLVAFACPGAGYLDGPQWRADEHEVDRWCRLVSAAGGRCDRGDGRLTGPAPEALDGPEGPGDGSVVLHPGAASGSRRWPVSRWREVARALAARGDEVVVTGVASEGELCGAVAAAAPGGWDASGQLTLAELSGLVARARLVVCGDTGVAHLATAWGTPSVLLFGPTSPRLWGPAVDHDRHVALWHGDEAEPPGDPHGDDVDPRLARITVDEVLDAADVALAEGRARAG